MDGNGSRRVRLYVRTAYSINLRTEFILPYAVPYQTEFNVYYKRLLFAERDCGLAAQLHDEVARRLQARQKAGIPLPDRLPTIPLPEYLPLSETD